MAENILQALPLEIAVQIVWWLDDADRARLAQTCLVMLRAFAVLGYMRLEIASPDDWKTLEQQLDGGMPLEHTDVAVIEDAHSLEIVASMKSNGYVLFRRLVSSRSIDLFHTSWISESMICALAGVHTINLGSTPVTDVGLATLAGVHSINLQDCTRVSDAGIQSLAGVHTIDLANTEVTDEGIKALAGVHTIDLTGTSVTKDGIAALKAANNLTR